MNEFFETDSDELYTQAIMNVCRRGDVCDKYAVWKEMVGLYPHVDLAYEDFDAFRARYGGSKMIELWTHAWERLAAEPLEAEERTGEYEEPGYVTKLKESLAEDLRPLFYGKTQC